jgi:hypothetical protein
MDDLFDDRSVRSDVVSGLLYDILENVPEERRPAIALTLAAELIEYAAFESRHRSADSPTSHLLLIAASLEGIAERI